MKLMRMKDYIDLAQAYADINSGCRKVAVGCVIEKNGNIVSMGANRAIPDLCKTRGCLRVEKYGNDSKSHRNPEDCRAIHSEIDAISKAGVDLNGAHIFVTRYPCEACAKAIIVSGIKHVYYGGDAEISPQTISMFESNMVNYSHVEGYKDGTDR